MVLLVHLASVWVPFTSESKEAIAHYPEILKEIKLALRECGRKLSIHLRRKERAMLQAKRRGIFEVYIGELIAALHKLTGADQAGIPEEVESREAAEPNGELETERKAMDAPVAKRAPAPKPKKRRARGK
jgi:DNA topoisomerase VI subunit B